MTTDAKQPRHVHSTIMEILGIGNIMCMIDHFYFIYFLRRQMHSHRYFQKKNFFSIFSEKSRISYKLKIIAQLKMMKTILQNGRVSGLWFQLKTFYPSRKCGVFTLVQIISDARQYHTCAILMMLKSCLGISNIFWFWKSFVYTYLTFWHTIGLASEIICRIKTPHFLDRKFLTETIIPRTVHFAILLSSFLIGW